MESTMDFLHDLRSRVIGQPEISTDGFHPYRVAMRDALGDSTSHGAIVKTCSVTHLVKEAQGRYSPAAVVAVSKEVVTGDADQYISTGYVEQQNLLLCMGSRQERLTAPSNYRRPTGTFEGVCRHIARSWDGIVPPASFDRKRASY
jgi:hypothetical protein